MGYNMHLIEVGFSRAKSKTAILSKAIQLAEKRPFSHAFITFLEPKTQTKMVVQASHGMVNTCAYSHFLKENVVVKRYLMNFTQAQFDIFWAKTLITLGIPYSLWQDVVIAFMKLFQCKKVFFINGSMAEICSEWAAIVCSIYGIALPEIKDTITPSELEFILSKSNLKCEEGA